MANSEAAAEDIVTEDYNRIDDLKRDKIIAKSAFTRCKNQLFLLLDDDPELQPSRRLIREATKKLNGAQEHVIRIMSKLSDEFRKPDDREYKLKITNELEVIDTEYSDIISRMREFLDLKKDILSSLAPSEADEINKTAADDRLPDVPRFRPSQPASQPSVRNSQSCNRGPQPVQGPQPLVPPQSQPSPQSSQPDKIIPHLTALGHDISKQLKRVSIPIFSGDKQMYENWKAAFMACIDQAPATSEYKLLQLRQYLSGDALKVVEKLGFSAYAYTAAKDRLDRNLEENGARFQDTLKSLRGFQPKSLAHDEAVQRLYEEMETQIKQTKDSLLAELQQLERTIQGSKIIKGSAEQNTGFQILIQQIKRKKEIQQPEKSRQYAIREELERNLADKDSHLQDMLVTHQEMQDRLSGLNFSEMESKHENERLIKEKDDLEDILFSSQQKLEESRMYIDKLRDQQRDDKRERARAAIKLTEGIAIERESLVKQLDMLRDINKKLRDDRDIAEASQCSVEAECPSGSSSCSSASAMQSTPRGKQLVKQGSVLSNYFSRDDSLQMDPVHALIAESAVELERNGDIYDRISQSDSMNAMNFGIEDIEEDCEVDYDNELLMDPGHWSKIQNEMSKQQLTPPSLNGFVGFGNHNSHGAGPSSSCHDDGCYRRRSGVEATSDDIPEDRSDKMDQKELKTESCSSHDNRRHRRHHGYDEKVESSLDEASGGVNHISNNCHPVSRTHSVDLPDSASKDRKLMRMDCLPGNHRRSLTLSDNISSSDSENPDIRKGWRERRVRKQRQKVEQNGSVPSIQGKKPHSASDTDFLPSSPRVQPVGASTCPVVTKERQHPIELASPQRLFKIVFVGDSGVGKSTFIQQFCHNEFIPTFSATIGVDFQVKAVMVDDYMVALQLWDTAGQERFRSITKQYFRKADGVLVMYDVTSERTFTNVRNWMASVQEGVDEGTILAIMGNKTDLLSDDGHRAIKEKDGASLATEFGAVFYEGSAKTGKNVEAAMLAMANLLKEKEDKDLEMAMTLDLTKPKKKGCCS